MYWIRSGAVGLTAWVLKIEEVRAAQYNFMRRFPLEKEGVVI